MISVGSVVQVYPGPPAFSLMGFGLASLDVFDGCDVVMLPGRWSDLSVIELDGAVAQLGEHLLCKQGVSGSIPLSSTIVLS